MYLEIVSPEATLFQGEVNAGCYLCGHGIKASRNDEVSPWIMAFEDAYNWAPNKP